MKYIIYVILVALSLMFIYEKIDNFSLKKDIIILNDSLTLSKNKAGELYTYKETVELTLKDLQRTNKELYDEVNKLKENPLVTTKIVTKIIYKDKILRDTMYIDTLNNINVKFNFTEIYDKDNYIIFNGHSRINTESKKSETYLRDFVLKTKIYNTITTKNDKVYVNSRSDFPGIEFESVDSYIISDKRKRNKKWGISIFGGPTYIPYTNTFGIGVGCGISYDFIKF